MKSRSFLWVIILLISGCGDSSVFENNHDFSAGYWLQDEPVSFQFVIPKPGKYKLMYNVRNSLDYPYSRLYIQYHLTDSLGNTKQKNLLEADLFEYKTGKPLGQGGIGDVFDHQLTLSDSLRFDDSGTYHIELNQYMRRDTLPGIFSVGISVTDIAP